MTGGALSPHEQQWLPAPKGFLFPRPALSKVFRGKYLEFLAQAYRNGELQLPPADDEDTIDAFAYLVARLREHTWVVYAKAPFNSTAQVLAYLGRYTHRVAIANHRLVSFDGDNVAFRWRDYAHNNKSKVMRLTTAEFIRRFLLHTLPNGFTRIRHYGVLANRCRARKLTRCRELLDQPEHQGRDDETAPVMMQRLTGIDITRCPRCRVGTVRHTLAFQPAPSSYRSRRATGPP